MARAWEALLDELKSSDGMNENESREGESDNEEGILDGEEPGT